MPGVHAWISHPLLETVRTGEVRRLPRGSILLRNDGTRIVIEDSTSPIIDDGMQPTVDQFVAETSASSVLGPEARFAGSPYPDATQKLAQAADAVLMDRGAIDARVGAVIERAFEGAEMPEARVRQMLVEILESPLAVDAAKEMEAKLGRKLEPSDIWYEFGQDTGPETALDAITQKKYPNAAAFEKDIPYNVALVQLSPPDAHGDVAGRLVFELDGEVHGKPLDAATATARIRAMRGRSGVLHTGHWLIDTREDDDATGATLGATASTTVHFAAIDDDGASTPLQYYRQRRVSVGPSSPEGWELMEKRLLVAQRQESLRGRSSKSSTIPTIISETQ